MARGVALWLVSLAWPTAYLVLRPDGVAEVGRGSEQVWITVLRYNPLVHLGEFTLGIACGLRFLARGVSRQGRPRVAAAVAPLAVLGVLALGDAVPYALLHSGLLAPLFAAIIYALACGGGAAARVLAARPMVKLGEASYALYLLHLPIAGFFVYAEQRLGVTGAAAWGLTACAIVTAVVVSLIVFARVEEPSRRFLRTFSRRHVVGNQTVTRVAGS
jgi:peptidoglycan/LPS O-acetylase OafA/YrhL